MKSPSLAENLISIQSLSKTFNGLKVLDGINFEVKKNEIISILGPSGCGKTTLLKIIGGLISGASKSIQADSIGFVFQKPSLLPWKSVHEHLILPLQIKKIADKSNIQNIIKFVGLKSFEKFYPNQLSGGMQQRLAMGMALAYNPEILLMDEPFSALDEITRNKLQEELLRIFDQSDTVKSIVYVTHSIEEAVFLSDKVIILSEKPSTIKKIVKINLEKPRNANIRNSNEFFSYIKTIRSLL